MDDAGAPLAPAAPEDVRLVDIHGDEIEASRIVYVGRDPDSGLYRYEAWFPMNVELASPPDGRVGKLPAKTSIAFCFYPV
jgi:hypothetical protein